MNHTNTQKGDLREELRKMLGRNIAVDGGAVATKYLHEIEDFIARTIASETTKATDALIEEMMKEVSEKTRSVGAAVRSAESIGKEGTSKGPIAQARRDGWSQGTVEAWQILRSHLS